MQKEIDALREAQKLLQQRLREMEMSNDDMEQNDRYFLQVNLANWLKGREIFVGGCTNEV